MNRADLGKALMMVGACLAITSLGAFLLATYGEGGSGAKAATLFPVQVGMWSAFLVGYHFRFSPEKRKNQRRAKEILPRLVRGARHIRITSGPVLHAHHK